MSVEGLCKQPGSAGYVYRLWLDWPMAGPSGAARLSGDPVLGCVRGGGVVSWEHVPHCF